MKLCEECGRPLTGRQLVICADPECFRLRMNRRARKHRQLEYQKRDKMEAGVSAIKRIALTFDFQRAKSPEKAIKIFNEIVNT